MLGAVDALSIVNGADARSKKASVRLVHKQIEARLAAPREPGAYEVTIAVRDRRFGRTATKGSTLVYVPGERRGAILVSDPVPALAGSSLALDVVVVNTGTADWSDAAARAAPFAELMEPRATTVRAIWTPLGDGGPAAPDPIDLLAVPLAPGEGTSATLAVPTPATPGDWVLTLDIVDRLDGSFAAGGSAPRTVRTTIVDERDPTGPRRDP